MDLENLLNLNLSSLMGSQQVSSHTFRRSEGEVWLSLHLEKASQTKEMRGHMNNLGAPGSWTPYPNMFPKIGRISDIDILYHVWSTPIDLLTELEASNRAYASLASMLGII